MVQGLESDFTSASSMASPSATAQPAGVRPTPKQPAKRHKQQVRYVGSVYGISIYTCELKKRSSNNSNNTLAVDFTLQEKEELSCPLPKLSEEEMGRYKGFWSRFRSTSSVSLGSAAESVVSIDSAANNSYAPSVPSPTESVHSPTAPPSEASSLPRPVPSPASLPTQLGVCGQCQIFYQPADVEALGERCRACKSPLTLLGTASTSPSTPTPSPAHSNNTAPAAERPEQVTGPGPGAVTPKASGTQVMQSTMPPTNLPQQSAVTQAPPQQVMQSTAPSTHVSQQTTMAAVMPSTIPSLPQQTAPGATGPLGAVMLQAKPNPPQPPAAAGSHQGIMPTMTPPTHVPQQPTPVPGPQAVTPAASAGTQVMQSVIPSTNHVPQQPAPTGPQVTQAAVMPSPTPSTNVPQQPAPAAGPQVTPDHR